MTDPATVDPVAATRRLARSERLTRRRYELIPLRGAGAAFTDVQGRQPGSPSSAPADLAELISSIASVGLLQPILVEDLDRGRRRLVAGERRLRSMQWLAAHHPDPERFATIAAVVCPGPLPEEDRRVWQLVENLAREDLRPGELAAALMFERCAVLTAKLLAARVPVPADVAGRDDPCDRFAALDQLRRAQQQPTLGAPWEEVLRRLGVQMTRRKAQQLVTALKTLPAELSTEMDDAGVALHTRINYLRLDRGHRDAARQLWDAVRARGRPDLLTAAVRARLADPHLAADAAVDAAADLHESANLARKLQPGARHATDDLNGLDTGTPPTSPADLELAAAAGVLRQLCAALRAGAAVSGYDAGSLRLLLHELLALLPDTRPDTATAAAA